MGCGSSVEDNTVVPPKIKYRKDLNHVWEDEEDDGLVDYLGDPTDMNPHLKKGFACSTFAKKVTSDHIDQFGNITPLPTPIVMTHRDERELRHLAMCFGRDARGRQIQDYYLPQVKDFTMEDGSQESQIFKRIAEMEKDETMLSDGRLTPEPNSISCSISYSIESKKASWACKEHVKDDDEMRFINRPCDHDVVLKCRQWDGCHSLGKDLFNPGVHYQEGGNSSSSPNVKKLVAATVNSNSTATTDGNSADAHPFAPQS